MTWFSGIELINDTIWRIFKWICNLKITRQIDLDLRYLAYEWCDLTNFIAGHDTGAQGLGQHLMSMNANHYLPTNDNQIPTGELADVGGTVFDLRVPSKPLSEMLPNCPGGDNNGFDHNFCVNGDPDQFRHSVWKSLKMSHFKF